MLGCENEASNVLELILTRGMYMGPVYYFRPMLPDISPTESKKCTVLGNLRYPEKEITDPAVFTKIRIYDNKSGTKLITLFPDGEGNFSFNFEASEKSFWKSDNRTFRADVVHFRAPFAKENGLFAYWNAKQVVSSHEIKVPRDKDSETQIFIPVHQDHFDQTSKIPTQDIPHFSYICEFLNKIVPEVVQSGLEKVIEKILGIAGKFLSGIQAQELLQKMGFVCPPPIPNTVERLIELLLNSVAAATPKIEGDKAIWECNWDRFDKDIEKSLANVRIVVALDPERKQKPVFEKITLHFSGENEFEEYDAYSEGIERAVYLALSAFITQGEGKRHLGIGHLVTGLFANEFRKCIPKTHPLYNLLDPHFEGVNFINYLGSKGIIFGDKSILELGALTSDSLNQLIIEGMVDGINWATYSPPKPVAGPEIHYLAHGEKETYQGLLKVFGKIINDKWAELSKPDNWSHLWLWSSRIRYHFRSFPEFILGEKEPVAGDKERLVKFLAYTLTLIYIHYMAHSSQTALTNILSSSLGVRNKALTVDGKFAPDGNTDSYTTVKQLFIANFLMAFEAKKMIEENNNVHPEIRALFRDLITIGSLKHYEKAKELHKGVVI